MKALSIAATGMGARQLSLEVTANNIANMTTTGFKRQRAEFQDLMYTDHRAVGSSSSSSGTVVPTGTQVGSGVKVAAVIRVQEQGNQVITHNPYDLAIQGPGHFRIIRPDGSIAYTRAGAFSLDPAGKIVTIDGHTVSPGVTVPSNAEKVAINPAGEVYVQLQGQVQPQLVGKIDVATFPNVGGLNAIDGNLLLETTASGAAIVGTAGLNGLGTILQAAVESSNVSPVEEVSRMVMEQRGYEMCAKVVSASDEMMSSLSKIR